jgi:hypothetical protein
LDWIGLDWIGDAAQNRTNAAYVALLKESKANTFFVIGALAGILIGIFVPNVVSLKEPEQC